MMARFKKMPNFDLQHLILIYFSKKWFWKDFCTKCTIFIVGTF